MISQDLRKRDQIVAEELDMLRARLDELERFQKRGLTSWIPGLGYEHEKGTSRTVFPPPPPEAAQTTTWVLLHFFDKTFQLWRALLESLTTVFIQAEFCCTDFSSFLTLLQPKWKLVMCIPSSVSLEICLWSNVALFSRWSTVHFEECAHICCRTICKNDVCGLRSTVSYTPCPKNNLSFGLPFQLRACVYTH